MKKKIVFKLNECTEELIFRHKINFRQTQMYIRFKNRHNILNRNFLNHKAFNQGSAEFTPCL